MVKEKRLPSPGTLWSLVSPPCISTRRLTVTRPNPVPSRIPFGGGADLTEVFEDGGLVFGSDANSGIRYNDLDSLRTRASGFEDDGASIRRELDGVAEQIEQDFAEANAVCHDTQG